MRISVFLFISSTVELTFTSKRSDTKQWDSVPASPWTIKSEHLQKIRSFISRKKNCIFFFVKLEVSHLLNYNHICTKSCLLLLWFMLDDWSLEWMKYFDWRFAFLKIQSSISRKKTFFSWKFRNYYNFK